MLVGNIAEQPTADRSHKEAGGENTGGLQQLRGAVARWKERGGKINGTEGVNVKIKPLHQIA